MRTVQHWIDGGLHTDRQGGFGAVYNPATGATIAEVDFAGADGVDKAVGCARRAAREWARVPLARRVQLLFRLRDVLAANSDKITAQISEEHGKMRDDARGELARGLDVVDYACGLPQLLKGESSPEVSSGVDVVSLREHVGVVCGITPFNFPAMVPLWMFPMALACGNTFLLKPSERDPSTSMLLADAVREAGIPDGVFQVVHGDASTVEHLLQHDGIDAVSFVGSTSVAKQIYVNAASAGKRVQALGGAKNHMVVLGDADLESAADAAVSAAFGSAGQRCMAISVVVAVESIAAELVAAIANRASQLRVGAADDSKSDVGPLISAAQRDRVVELIGTGVAEGARLAVDGRTAVAGTAGFFVGPTVFDHVAASMRIYEEEIFGPVLCVLRVADAAEALALVNRNRYGNGAAVFTSDGGAARHFVAHVEAGMVGVNVAIPVPVAWHSFGGRGDSLFGDLHVYGPDAIRFYTRGKVVTSRWMPPAQTSLHFPTNS